MTILDFKPLALLLAAALCAGCSSDDSAEPSQPSPQDLFEQQRTLNIAHRGGKKNAPEETLPAFQLALDEGADALEFDLHATSDGRLVVLHDDTVDRTTDGTGAVKEMTFEQLRKLDAAYRFSPDGQTFPERGKGITIPHPRRSSALTRTPGS